MLLPCLYCLGDEPRTYEHVLQKGFNTTWVLDDDVCGGCNSRSSLYDTELIRFVRSITHANSIAVTPRKSILQGHGLMQDPETKLWLSVRLTPNDAPTTFDQILLPSDGRIIPISGGGSCWQQRFASITEELRAPEKLKVETKIVEQTAVDTAIVRSAPFKYLIVAHSQQDADRARKFINSCPSMTMTVDHENPGQARTIQHPQVEIRQSYNMASIGAGLVKTAVNFVCATLGPDAARGPELSAAREYVLNPQAADHEKFVRFVFGDPAASGLKRFARPGHHTVGLFGLPAATVVVIVLYEEPLAVITLAAQPILHIVDSRFAYFDYQSRRYEVLRLRNDVQDLFRHLCQAAT